MEVDPELLYVALDARRRQLGMRRKDVTAALGVRASCWTYWEHGGSPNADVLLRACAWLGQDVLSFVKKNA
jgi:transcriptional regulator with XRE-family HTH domain